MFKKDKKDAWYIDGLRFECRQCGNCCSGPAPGFIWVTNKEIEDISGSLDMPIDQLRQNYLRRVGQRVSIKENLVTRDCIFLTKIGGRKGCMIYPVRPVQCRTWPFWLSNLASKEAWDSSALRCGGMNTGRHYSFEEIESIRERKGNGAAND